MAEAPLRPVFTERQVISSADLNLVVSHEADGAARTRRALTTPGVVSGLRLATVDVPRTLSDQTVVVTKKVTVTRGTFIDEVGRLVVAPDDVPLSETDIEGTLTEDTATAHLSYPLPVFIASSDVAQPGARSVGGGCAASGGPRRVAERYRIRIGRPGDELPRQRPTLAPGVGDDGDGRDAEVLLGFVRVHMTAGKFAEVVDSVDQVHRAVAGLRGDAVAGRAGRVAVQTADPVVAGTAVALLESTGEKVLTVGFSDGRGAMSELFSVDAKGDAFVKGALHAKRSEEGRVAVESGLINHGLRVPLPPGVSEADVASGAQVLHIQLSAWSPPGPGGTSPLVISSFGIDENRRVACHTFNPVALGAPGTPGTCAYLVVASVPPAGAQP